MGQLTRWLASAAGTLGLLLIAAAPVAAFDGFGESTADATFEREIRFEVELTGDVPERVELLLRSPGSDATFVVPTDASGGSASYTWDTSVEYLTPNTLVTYQWRAIEGDEEVLSDEAVIRYEDDRPGLDWQSVQLDETTVHWYGDAEAQALRFGELAAVGVAEGEALLGTELAGPVDVFVYDSREDFFAALGPGAREWTGAGAFPEIRTIFMWLGGGSEDYLEVAMIHEITHIVFFDATDNPYHEPATWLNEGIASWSETDDGSGATALVRSQAANGNGPFAFEAIGQRFPIGDLGSSLSYAQGTAMVDFIIERHGQEAIARMTAAYRDGASDAEALEIATGSPAGELYAAFYAEFGVEAPQPVAPEPLAGSTVERPEAGVVDPGGVDGAPGVPSVDPAPSPAARAGQIPPWLLALILGLAVAAVAVIAVLVTRRANRRASG